MKKNIRTKISDFLTSEEGRVGVKPPLALGAASTSLLLAHAMISPPTHANWDCYSNDDCPEGEGCAILCYEWDVGTCVGGWYSRCESLDS